MDFRSVKTDPPAHGQRVLVYFRGIRGQWVEEFGRVLHNDGESIFEYSDGTDEALSRFELWIPVPMPEEVGE